MSKAAGKLTMQFEKDKETKNMTKYVETGDQERPISLYLRNTDIAKRKLGDELTVEIKNAE